METLGRNTDHFKIGVHGHWELNGFITGSRHPHDQTSIDDKSTDCELEDILLHSFESVRALRRDVTWAAIHCGQI